MRISNNAVWFVLMWLANFSIAVIVLFDVINGVFAYKNNLVDIESAIQTHKFICKGGDVQKLKQGDAVIFCDEDGWICAPRTPDYRERFVNLRLMDAVGYRAGGSVYLGVDERCPARVVSSRIEELLQISTNVFVVGHADDDVRRWVCVGWKGLDEMEYQGVEIDLSPIRSLRYGNPYYMFNLYRCAVDLIKGRFHLKDSVIY